MPRTHSAAAREIGRRIRSAREELGLTLEDLGELSEVNTTTIGKIERGQASPGVETLIRVATALEVDAGVLVSGVSADDYGKRTHRFTAKDFLRARREQSA